MPTWLKVILVVVAVGIAGLLALGVGGYWWFTRNKDRFVEMGKRARADATAYAAAHDGAQCLDEALERLDRADGILDQAEVKVFLGFCLDDARESPGLCDDVPPRSEIMRSATWAVGRCAALGRAGSQPCSQLVQAVQEHCGRGRSTAPAGGAQ